MIKSSKYLGSFNIAVERFGVACAPHYIKECSNPLFVSILKAIDCIKTGKTKEAKELLTILYKDVQEKYAQLSKRDLIEFFLVISKFKDTTETHYPRNAKEIECYAALELILDRPGLHSSDKTMLHYLFELHMEDCIKGSVWEKAMRKENRKVRQREHSMHASTPQVTHAMHKALGVKESS